MQVNFRLVVASLVLLAPGCLDDSQEEREATQAACENMVVPEVGCVKWTELEVGFEECQRSTMTLESRTVVFDLPPGYSNVGTPANPQRLQFAVDRCQVAFAGNASASDVSIGYAGVLVTAPPAGQPDTTEVYVLEFMTDTSWLAELVASAGFPVVNATIDIVDSGPNRRVTVSGGSTYQMDVVMSPRDGGGSLTFSQVLLRNQVWMHAEQTCSYYEVAGIGRFTAERGTMADAIPTEGFLAGASSQAITCSESNSFGELA